VIDLQSLLANRFHLKCYREARESSSMAVQPGAVKNTPKAGIRRAMGCSSNTEVAAVPYDRCAWAAAAACFGAFTCSVVDRPDPALPCEFDGVTEKVD
jgi:hypothetical protein